MTTTIEPTGVPARSFWLLRAASFISNFDRFSIGPILVVIGTSLRIPLSTVILAASGYYLCYGLMQPVWGIASDRFGRVWVMRVSFAGAAVASACSTFAPNGVVLICARSIAGAFFAAAIAATLTYVGDVVPASIRQRPLSDLMTTLALATALATVVAGAIAHYLSWRVVFALPGLLAIYLAVALRRLPEPEREDAGAAPLVAVGTVLRSGWQWYVLLVAFLEGAVLLGFLTYLAPALESEGVPTALAGAVSALYGVGAMTASRFVKRLVGNWSPARIILLGGVFILAAYVVAALSLATPAIMATALLLGAGWSFMHSTLQSWATVLVPSARATSVAMFGLALYVGSAVASGVVSAAAEAHQYQGMFLVAGVLSVPLTIAAVCGRARYR